MLSEGLDVLYTYLRNSIQEIFSRLAMTSLRAFQPQDLLRMNLTNLDPLTENYNVDFYMHYLTRWPSLFTLAEDQYGNITGYSKHLMLYQPIPSC